MRRTSICWILAAALALPLLAHAGPPDHAPAHGHRAKHGKKKHHEHRHQEPGPGEVEREGGVRIVFDSERGISVAVGFPGVYFHAGHFYRRHDGKWQKSARADAGWETISARTAPGEVRAAHDRAGAARMR